MIVSSGKLKQNNMLSTYDEINQNYVTVWITLIPASTFPKLCFFFFFFFFCSAAIVDFVNCEQCIHILFTVPQITFFSNFFIKNGSHSTIYTFKNYFATVFSVSVFSFSKNKLNPNRPYVCLVIRNQQSLFGGKVSMEP